MAAARRVHASAIYGSLLTATLAVSAGAGVILDGLHGYYVGTLIGVSVLVVGGILYLYRQEGLPVYSGRMSVLQEMRRHPQVLSFAGALYLLSFTSPLADLVARYAVLHSGGLRSAGLFQAAFGIALALRTVVRSSFSVFLMPTVNRKADAKEKFQKTVEFLRALAIITGLMGLPLVLFPDVWLVLLYSPRFVPASPYVYLFVCAIIVQLFGAAALALLVGLDRIGTYVGVFLAGDLATATISWWLVPILGFNGAGIAFLLNGVLVFSLSAWALWSKYRMNMPKAMGSLPWCVLAFVAAAGAVANLLHSNSLDATAAKVLFGLILAGLMVASTRRDSGNLLQGFWRSRRS
jgi:O-antigen/teichoic acid export membrane protein